VTAPAGKLKHPSGWFAAGREVSRALGLLSDGAFRLFIYLCLNADRRTGQMRITHGDLAKAVGRSRRSIVIYMEELQRQQVCRVQSATNQHDSGHIEICDAFWPYEKTRKEAATQDRASYVARIQRLMGSRRCVASSFAPAASGVTLKPANGGQGKTGQRKWPGTKLFYPAASCEGKSVFVRQLRGPHLRTCPWWRRRSSMAVTAALSPNSLPQSSTGRLEVSKVLARS